MKKFTMFLIGFFLFSNNNFIFCQDPFDEHLIHISSVSKCKIDSAISEDYKFIYEYNEYDSLISALLLSKIRNSKITYNYGNNKKLKSIFYKMWDSDLNKYIPANLKRIGGPYPAKSEFFYNDDQDLILYFEYDFDLENQKYVPSIKKQFFYKNNVTEEYFYIWNAEETTFDITRKGIVSKSPNKLVSKFFFWDKENKKFYSNYQDMYEQKYNSKRNLIYKNAETVAGGKQISNFSYIEKEDSSLLIVESIAYGDKLDSFLKIEQIFDLNKFLIEKTEYKKNHITENMDVYLKTKRTLESESKNNLVLKRTVQSYDSDFQRLVKLPEKDLLEYYSLKKKVND